MARYAQLIARVESKNKLPKGLLAGIAKAESSFGTAGRSGHDVNPFGWMRAGGPAAGLMRFPNMAAAIRHVGNTLGERGWRDPADFGKTYVGEASWADVWLPNVRSVMSQLGKGVPDAPGRNPRNPNQNPRNPRNPRSAAVSAMTTRERMTLGMSLVHSWRNGGFMSALPMILELQKYPGGLGRATVDGAEGPGGVTPIVDRSNPRTQKDRNTVTNAIQLAKEYIGTPYVFGSAGGRSDFSNPTAFDCSGFISFLVKQVTNGRVKVTPQTGAMVRQGKKISTKIDSLKPGDAVFFGDVFNAKGHVGMYIGSGRFIHASSGAGAVTISNLREYARHSPIQAARRYIGV